MKPKYFFSILINLLLFIYLSPIFSQTAKIISANFERSAYSSQYDQNINLKVEVRNTGTTALSGLRLNVRLEGPDGISISNRKWIDLPKLSPNQLYSTGYKFYWQIVVEANYSAQKGIYTATIDLRDSTKIYDLDVPDSFIVN